MNGGGEAPYRARQRALKERTRAARRGRMLFVAKRGRNDMGDSYIAGRNKNKRNRKARGW